MEVPGQSSRVFLLCLVPVVKAYTVFETTCSTPGPQSDFNFVSSPNTRGTLDILWSSLFTILACTWTLQHPNIPEQRDGRDPGRRGDLKWRLKGFYKSAMRMLSTAIAPELIVGAACEDLVSARQEYRQMQKYADEDGVAWTVTHSYFADMGGFVIRSKQTGKKDYNDPYHLNAKGIYELRHQGHLPSLPNIAAEEILDKSKGDAFAKTIAVGQILWTLLQIIVRAARKLPVSPLEIAVVAFAFCAIITYGLYWNKPQRVCTTYTILDYAEEIPKEVLESIMRTSAVRRPLKTFFFIQSRSLYGSAIATGSLKPNSDYNFWFGASATLVVTAIFGGIHVAVWNFSFPTRIELIFWRCASVFSAALPLGFVLFSICFALIASPKKTTPEKAEKAYSMFFLLPSSCLYVVARLFILVEMFRTLCYLPAGSYLSTWASNVPHVA